CHAMERFDSPAHDFHKHEHKHKPGSASPSCLSCHMPTRPYMVVHERHDHSFRVPRPDLSVKLGVPNACTGCHRDRTAAWAAGKALAGWGGKRRADPHYGEVLHAGREELPGAPAALVALASDTSRPAIVRATALELLAGADGRVPAGPLRAAAADPDPDVRRGAISPTPAPHPHTPTAR